MASESRKRLAVESDFLLGLRKSDRRHANVVTALEMHKEGSFAISLISSAILEVRAVLYSRGIGSSGAEEAFSLMAALLAQYGVTDSTGLDLGDVVVAERMRGDVPGLTFFDSLHAAIARRAGATLLSSEGAYLQLGLPVIDLDRLKR